MAVSFPIEPMRAVAGVLPRPDEQDQWAYEVKWDGMRIIAFVAADATVRLQSAKPREVTASFPELTGATGAASLAAAIGGRPAVLDGEVVALDDAGRPSFGRLQQRIHLTEPGEVARRAAAVPVALQIFDLLSFDGHDTLSLPYLDRRRLLSDLVEPGPSWSVPSHYLEDGAGLLQRVSALGLEGLMAKRRDSIYQLGRRSPTWRKIKVRARQEFVVGGWAPGEGKRAGRLASLLVGAHDEQGRLRFAGRVGTGFNDGELRRLDALMGSLGVPEPPFVELPEAERRRPAHWVRPAIVVEVAFAEWTEDRILRHPSYLGQRDDKAPAAVTFLP